LTTIDSGGNKITNWTTFHVAENLNEDCILGLLWCRVAKPFFDWGTNKITTNNSKINSIKQISLPQFLDLVEDFFHEEPPLPKNSKYDCLIGTKGKLPQKISKLRPMSENERICLREDLDNLLRRGYITESDSTFTSPVLLVPQKNKIRVCIDHGLLNTFIISDPYPMPLIQDIFQRIKDFEVFSKLDLTEA
jgi:hypothetical protein